MIKIMINLLRYLSTFMNEDVSKVVTLNFFLSLSLFHVVCFERSLSNTPINEFTEPADP